MKRPDVEIINRQNIFEITEDLEKLIKKPLKPPLNARVSRQNATLTFNLSTTDSSAN